MKIKINYGPITNRIDKLGDNQEPEWIQAWKLWVNNKPTKVGNGKCFPICLTTEAK